MGVAKIFFGGGKHFFKKIFKKFAKNLQKMFNKFLKNIQKYSKNFQRNMQKIFKKYAKNFRNFGKFSQNFSANCVFGPYSQKLTPCILNCEKPMLI